MRKDTHRYVYTPSDLLEFLSSPFATWMTRRWLDDPTAAQPDAESAQQLSLGEHGRRHEQAFLKQLRDQGRHVYRVPSGGDRAALTRSAMQAGHEVIFHGLLAEADRLGEADFLIRVEAPSRPPPRAGLPQAAPRPGPPRLSRPVRRGSRGAHPQRYAGGTRGDFPRPAGRG